MNQYQVVDIIRRWWWFMLLIPMLAGITAYTVSARQSPMYAASALLLVNPPQSTSSLDYNAVLAGQSLAETYSQLVSTWPVLQPVVDELQLPYGVDELRERISVSTVPETRIIVIEVQGRDPQNAAIIANAVGNQFSAYISEQATQVSQSSRVLIDEQIADTESQIAELQQQEQTLEVRAALNQLQQTYSTLLLTAQTMDLNAEAMRSQISVAVPASAPAQPFAPRVMLATVFGMLPSFMICGGAVALMEYLRREAIPRTPHASRRTQRLVGRRASAPHIRIERDPAASVAP